MALTEEDLKKLPEDGIDTEVPGKYRALLEDLQGNILKGHGRNYGVHLFLKFKPNQVDAVKKSIQKFALCYVTSALLQAEEAYNFRVNNTKGSIFANFFLSRKGYEYLDIQPFKIPSDEAFRFGMKNDAVKDFLADPDVKTWDIGFQEEIHGLILMADDDLETLHEEVKLLSQDFLGVAEIVQQEVGFVLKNKAGQVIEHFGFADGISQPLFVKRDIDKAKANGFDKWDPRASLDIILTKDPNGHTEDSYGSYLVYRKLEQDVEAFRSAVDFLARQLGIGKELAGAYMVGRFADGTPVTLSDIPTHAATPTNNFNYDNDPDAFGLNAQPIKCPFHAHIRKTNPRGDTGRVVSSPDFQQSLDIEKGHRIARRAISYGDADSTKAPQTGSGLLFLCFQSDINNQFNFMQASWANQNNFVKVNVGNDPIIGVASGGKASPDVAGNRQWIKKWGEPEAKAEKDILEDGFKIWVHMKGGEYFFTPSISFLKNLGGN